MKMRNVFEQSDALYLLTFFVIVITVGTVLLMLPGVWQGERGVLTWTNATFTAASAVCVAGLGVVDITAFSRAGHIIILCLIQMGGLGIIGFSSFLLTIPGNRLGLSRRDTIQGFYLDGIEYRPLQIVRSILLFTLGIEAVWAVLLSALFQRAGVDQWLFMGIFHAVSAFCNTGVSPFAGGLSGFAADIPVLLVVMVLIILGGTGFIVLHDVVRLFRRQTTRLSYHSRVVLVMTALFVFGGMALFIVLERGQMYRAMDLPTALVNALFQSANTRSGGFEVVAQQGLTQPSKLLTSLLMLVGGAPGSIAGGIKITTVLVIVAVIVRKPDKNGDIRLFHHRLCADTVHKGVVYVLKALVLLLLCVSALSISEGFAGGKPFGALVFECISAFATVGLSLGITADLSTAGKWIIIVAMFAGRVGLIVLAFPSIRYRKYDITYPQGSLLLE
jgi:trk system potassium uptake protein TrkH